MYSQTGLSKSELAGQLGISRTTLHEWIRDNNWERLKKSGEFIPAFLAENIYQVIGNLTEHLLSEERIGKPVTMQEANTIHKLTLTIGKLKTRATLNENMETFAYFTEHLVNADFDLAKKLQPHINDFIHAQAAPAHKQYQPAKLDDIGYIPTPGPISQYLEKELDKDDLELWALQEKNKANQPTASAPSTPAHQVTSQPKPIPAPINAMPPVANNEINKMVQDVLTNKKFDAGSYNPNKNKHQLAA